MIKNQKSKIKNQKISIKVDGEQGFVSYAGHIQKVMLRRQPFLAAVAKVVPNARVIKEIEVKIKDATFSTTRQIVAQVNTLAWGLGIKVNGRSQLQAKYSGKPNITTP